MDCLRARHLARRIVRPVAVETDDAPLDTPRHPDHAGVLTDRVIHRVVSAVAYSGDSRTVTARYRLRSPRAICDFPYSVEADDLQLEFQNRPSFWAKREAIQPKAASHGGSTPS